MRLPRRRPPAVAILGLAGRFPGASDFAGFVDNLAAGVDSVVEVPPERWSLDRWYAEGRAQSGRSNSRWLGALADVDAFDARFFGLSPRAAEAMDPQQRLLLEVAWHCLEDAAVTPARLAAARTGVFVGVMAMDYLQVLADRRIAGEAGAGAGAYAFGLANRLSHVLGLSGPSHTVDAACASSLVALHQARAALLSGECDYALVAAASLNLDPWKSVGFAQAGMLSPTGRCRTFDIAADGYVPGDGVIAMLLRREDFARRDGERVRALVRGSATGHCAATAQISHPSAEAQARVVAAALDAAACAPDDIAYVEAHGTGTSLGDPIEVAGLNRVFAGVGHEIAIGSVKSNIGHLEAAAGLAGVAKVVGMMERRTFFPTLHVSRINPVIPFGDGPFRPRLETRPWAGGTPLRAGVSSFGVGGANSHVVLEHAAPARSPRRRPGGPFPVCLSARDPQALADLLARWRDFARSPRFAATPLADIAATAALGRASLRCRIATLAHDHAGLRDWLDGVQLPTDEGALEAPFVVALGPACRAERRLARSLARFGLRPAAITGWGAGVTTAEALARRLGLPFVDPRDGRHWPAAQADAAYLRQIVSAARGLDAALDAVLADAAALLGHQHSFRRLLAAWDTALGPGGDVATRLLDHAASGGGGARPAVALAVVDALRLLGRKWDLAPLDTAALAPLLELSGLVEAGALSRTDAVELLGGGDDARFDRLAAELPPLDPRGLPLLAARPRLAAGAADRAAWMRLDAPGFETADLCVLGGHDEASLRALAIQVWRRGALPDWSAVFPAGSFQRVVLPQYPFQRERFRIGRAALEQAAEAASVPDEVAADDARLYEAVWTPVSDALPPDGVVLSEYALESVEAGALSEAMDAHAGAMAFALVWPAASGLTPQALLDGPVRRAFACAAALARRADAARCSLLLVADTAAEPWVHGLLGGLAASLAHEFAGRVASVECDAGHAPGAVLPLRASGQRLRVDGGGVRRRVLRPSVLPSPRSVQPSADAVALITGGGGVIGRECAAALARLGWRRIALLGRRAPEVPIIAGVELRGFACDVADADALAATLHELRAWGPLAAVVHGAGALDDGLVVQQPWAAARAVIAGKLLGGLHLDRLTREDAPGLFVVHASVVGVLGNAGQTAYAAANGALEGLVEARCARGGETSGLALAWGLWRDGGMGGAATVEAFEQAGLPTLDARCAAPVLGAALSGAFGGSRVVLGGPLRAVSDAPSVAVPEAPATDSREAVERDLRARFAALTGDAPERIRAHDSFFDLGLGSLELQGLTTELGRRYAGVTPTLLFRHASLAALADFLCGQPRIADTSPPAPVPAEAASGPAATPPRPSAADAPPHRPEAGPDEPVAIIGMSGRFPLASDLWAYWDNLVTGRDCIRPVPPERWARALGARPPGAEARPRRGGFLDDVEGFEPLFFNLSMREAERMDPQQRLALENAWHTLEHAGYGRRERHAGRAVGVYLGTMWNDYSLYAAEQGYLAGGYGGPGAVYWQIPNRISYAFDFSGPSLALDTACSSSLTAIHLACQALRAGDCEMALAGGVNLSLHPAKYDYLEQGRFLSSDGRCRSFGAGGDGYVPGEGVASVLLKPLSRALADGDRVYGVVLGSSANHGGRAAGFTVPNPVAQQALIEAALSRAGVSPDAVSYVECHGTGTALGDPIEVSALAGAFAGRSASLPIGSVKSTIGHLEAAAGVAGLIKILLSLEYERLPPGLHADPANPQIDFSATPFEVLRAARDWPRGAVPRIAALSSFGAGGANAHALVAGPEYAATGVPADTGAPQRVVLSARSPAALERLCRRMAERIGPLRDPALTLSDLAATLATRETFDFGLEWQLSDLDDLATALRTAADALAEGHLTPQRPASASAATQARCSLPGTPFDNAPFWLPTLQQPGRFATAGTAAAGLPPLVPVGEAGPSAWRFTLSLDADAPWMRDHDIGGAPVLAAALGLELLREAVAASGALGEAFDLRDLVWQRAVVGDAALMIELRRDGSGLALQLADAQGPALRGLARAGTGFNTQPAPAVTDSVPVDRLYAGLAGDGMRYGEGYRSLRTLDLGDAGLVARLDEGGATVWRASRVLAPVLVDGALQAVLGWLRSRRDLAAAVPVAIGRVSWNAPLPAMPVVEARIADGPGVGRWSADIVLRDATGRACARLEEVVLQQVDPRRLGRPAGPSLAYSSLAWADAPGVPAEPPARVGVLALDGAPGDEVLAAWPDARAVRVRPGDAATPGTLVILLPDAADGWQEAMFAALRAALAADPVPRIVLAACSGRPEIGALSGLLRSLAREQRGADLRLLTTDAGPGGLAGALARECSLARPDDPELCFADGRRRMRVERAIEAAPEAQASFDGAWLITGGLGGLGLLIARSLIDRGARGVALVGRTADRPDAAQRAALEALSQRGVPVRTFAADVTDAAALRAAVLDAVAAIGPLSGVVHAAGTTRDGMLRAKSHDDFAAVLAPKLDGARALDAATADQPLRHFVLFSSISGVRGNLGQTDYAYANRFLDLFAAEREARVAAGERAGRSVSIDWPLWLDGGMQVDAPTRDWLRDSLGTEALDAERGLEAFARALTLGSPEVLVTLPVKSDLEAEAPAEVAAPVASGAGEALLDHLLALLAATTKIPRERLDPRRPVDDYGVDSVMAVEMVRALESDFGSLSRVLFFEHRSLEAVAAYLLAQRGEAVERRFGSRPATLAAHASPAVPAAQRVVYEGSAGRDAAIAVIGLAGRYPDAPDLDTFWRNLLAGHDAIREVPATRWNAAGQGGTGPLRGRVGGFLDDIDAFDPLLFGISPKDARLMDPQTRLFLECCLAALEDGAHAGCVAGREVGVFAAAMWGHYELLGAGVEDGAVPSSSFADIANRVSHAFGLNGPSLAVDTMCSGSLTALHLACESLRSGDCEMALAGGVNLSLRPEKYRQLIEGSFLSSDGRCRSFGDGGDGYVPGEGVGVALLKPLDRALADGDAIYGVIRGSAINHGGRVGGYTVPSPAAQAGVIARALARSGLDARDIDYVEAHGTGTALGDPIELAGLAEAFDAAAHPPSEPWRIGAVKSQIGHCEAAAGIAGLTRVLLQLRAGRIAPTLHAEPASAAIDWTTLPFRVVTRAEDWPVDAGRPRRAVVSAFGAGGANAHLVVEEAPPRVDTAASSSWQLVPVSARTADTLRATAAALADALAAHATPGGREDVRAALAAALAVPADELQDGDGLTDLGLDAATLERLFAALPERPGRDLLIGAETVGALLDRLAGPAGGRAPALDDIAFSLALGRLGLPERLCLRVDSTAALLAGLRAFASGAVLPSGVVHARAASGEAAVAARADAARAAAAGDDVALAQAWVRGGDVDWAARFATPRRRLRLPGCVLERKRYWYERPAAQPSAELQPAPAQAGTDDEAALEGWRARAAQYDGDAVTLAVGADGIARVTMQHAARRNMFDDDLALGLIRAFDRIAARPDVRVVLLAGSDEVFSMGGTPEMLQAIAAGEASFTDVPFFYRGLLECPVPVISAMAGHAYGGGLLFGLYADLPLLAEESLYSAVFADYGFSPGMGATLLLPERMGATLAAEMMYTARAFTGAELRARGVQLRVGPRARLMADALELAQSLAAKPRETLIAMKRSLARRLRECLPAAIAEEAAMHAETFRTEAVRALLARRFEPAGPVSSPIASAPGGEGAMPRAAPAPVRGLADEEPSPPAAALRLRPPERAYAPAAAQGADVAATVRSALARILMMSPDELADDRSFLEQGLDSIGSAELARALSAALGQRVEATALYDHPTPAALAAHLGAGRATALPVAPRVPLRPTQAAPAIAAAHPVAVERRAVVADGASAVAVPSVRERIAAILARLLQMPPDELAHDVPLTDQGLDSIGAVESVRGLNAAFGLQLEAVDLYDHPTVDQLVALLSVRSTEPAPVPAPEPTSPAVAVEPSPLAQGVPDDAVAVIGMACRYPGADDVEAFWKMLCEGRDAVAEVPASRWSGAWFDADTEAVGRSISRHAGLLDDVAGFDADFFRISPMEAEIMDPQQRIALEQCWRALEDAGLAPDRLAGRACGVFMGSAAGDYERLLAEAGQDLSAEAFTGLAPSILAARIAYHLDLTGPALSIDTACSSSLVAVHQARRALLDGDCELALAGGVIVMATPTLMVKSSKAGMLSPGGRCRPFADAADGIALAEGCGVVVLKRLSDALADGDPVHAVLRASGINQDGRTNGITAPSARSQAELMRRVYARAGLDPASVAYVEAHGTGTALGDPVEFKALCEVFADAPRGACLLGSVKASIGHATVAAGVAGFIKAVLAVREGAVPPLTHFQRPNPRIALDASPFRIPRSLERWDGAAPRRAAVSAFGFSGTNAHLVIEQAPGRAPTSDGAGALPFVLSAASEQALVAARAQLAAWLKGVGATCALADVATTLAEARAALARRWVAVAADRASLIAALESPEPPMVSGAWRDACRAWLDGGAVADFGALGGRRVHLPTYPFIHRAFWIAPQTAAGAPATTQADDRVVLAADDPLLAEHREGDPEASVPLLAGTAHVAAALAVARRRALAGAGSGVAAVRWFAPFRPQRLPAELQLCLDGAGSFETVSGAERELHASGRFITETSEREMVDLDALRGRCPAARSIEAFRAAFARKRLLLSGRFASLVALHAGDGEVLGTLRPPEGTSAFVPDPGVLDSALQCVAALIDPAFADDRLYLPVSLDVLRLAGDLRAAAFAHARDRGGDARRGRVFDVDVLDAEGRVLAEARGFALRRIERQAVEPVHLLVPQWRARVLPVAGGAAQRIASAEDAVEASARPVLVVWRGRSPERLFAEAARLAGRIAAQQRSGRVLAVGVDDEAAARALTGFAHSLALETPHVAMRVVLIGSAISDGDARLDALAAAPGPVLWRLDASGASTADYVPVERPEAKPVTLDGCWIVAGGFGRLGLAVAAHLARRGARIALLGRSAPSRHALDAIAAMREAGQAPLVLSRELADDAAVARAVAEIEAAAGPVRGFIHAAGTLRDATLANKAEADWQAVLDAKTGLARRFAAALRDAPLEAFVCFTSIAALKGQAGQTDYAFANGWLDGVAAGAELPWRAIAWPWWREGGMPMADEHVEHARRVLGIVPLETADGLAVLDTVLATGAARTLVVPGETARLLQFLRADATLATGPDVSPGGTSGGGADAVEAVLSALVVELLKLDPASVRRDTPFADYGFESITLTRLATRINRRLGLDLSPAVFFEADRIGALARLIVERHGEQLTGLEPTAGATPAVETEPAAEALPAEPAAARRADADSAIAVIGMDGRFPGGADPEAFWRRLEAGDDLVGEVPPSRWDWRDFDGPDAPAGAHTPSHWGGFLDGDVGRFDARFFGISPREAELMDPQQRLFLETTWRAIEDAGLRPGALAGTDTGVFAGVATADYMDLMLRRGAPLEGHGATGMSHGMLPNRISYLLDLHGPSEPVDTSCSSSLVAVARAVAALRRGDCRIAIAGGVNLLLSPTLYLAFGQAGMLSPTGRCRSFDADADGYVRGEGVGVVVLKRLSDAIADGDPIHGVIREIGVGHGGRASSLTAPNPVSQSRLIVEVLARCGVDAATVDYVETHGTGTPLGDPVEIAGLSRAFAAASRSPRTAPCALGAVKSNIGHLEAAAGIAGLFKVLLALRHRRLPANAHFGRLNPHVRLDAGLFEILDSTRDWPAGRDAAGRPRPRLAGLSSFGFGGVNAHALIEEAPAAASVHDDGAEQVIVLSARSETALAELARRTADRLEAAPALALASVAWTLQTGREAQPFRLALVARDTAAAAAALRAGQGLLARVDPLAAPPHSTPDADARALARAWVAGAVIDWAAVHGRAWPRVSLPATVFEGQRYWAEAARPLSVGASAAASGVVEAAGEVPADTLFLPAWVPLPAATPAARGGSAVVLRLSGDESLIAHIGRRHDEVRRVSSPDEVPVSSGVLYVLDADARPDARDAGTLAATEARLCALLRLVQRLPADAGVDVVLITRGATDAAGSPPARPSAAAGVGFMMSVSAERPAWRVRVVDLEAAAPVVSLDAVLDAPGPLLRALAAGQALQRVLHAAPPSSAMPPARGEVCVLLGGSGGLAGVFALDLARRAAARIALVGRRTEDAALRARLDEIAAAGGEAIYLCADAGDEEALRAVFETVRARWGAPARVIVATMVLRDATFATLDDGALLEVFRARARPAVVLDQVLAELGLSPAILHMSSVQSFCGNAGQANYAAGCAFLDAWAAATPTARVMNWGYWGSVGAVADDAHRAAMQAAGIGSIEPDEGIGAIDRLMGSPSRQMVMARGRPKALARLGVASGAPALTAALAALEAAVPPAVAATLALAGPAVPAFEEGAAWQATLGTPASQHRLLAAVLDIATRGAGQSAPDLDALARRHPAVAPHVALLKAALAGLPAVLRGEVEGTEVVLPDGSPALVEAIYAGNPLADAANARVAADCVARVGDGARRIIEIGAGTGGTSAAVLAAIAPLGVEEYRYTDVSRAFTQHGWRRFRSQFGFTRFEVLDIEREPATQDVPSGHFDLAIAANVLHATRDIVAVLRHLRGLLREGGTLLVNELTERLDFNTVTFGLLPGWWRFEDARRLAHAPLLDEAGWRSALAEAGFGEVDVWSNGGGLSVLSARLAVAGTPAVVSPRATRLAPDALPALFAEVLRMPVGEIDRRASFNDLGVDSLLAGELAARLGGLCGVRIRPTELFNHPSIERLEAHLAGLCIEDETPTAAVPAPEASEVTEDEDPLMTLLRRLERGELDADAAQRELDSGHG